jgi:hypothetical protein
VDKCSKKREDVKQKTEEVEVSTMKPVIDETSKMIVEKKLAEKRQGKSTHERLYDLNKELQQKKKAKVEEEQERFKHQSVNVSHADHHNMSSSKRDKPLDQTLYDDAERRRRDLVHRKKELDKIRDQPKDKMYHNDQSDMYVRKRFERDLQ